MALEKHVNTNHVMIEKKLKNKFIVLWGGIEKTTNKKDLMCLIVQYFF
jgi:hypothetical protein